MDNNTPMIRNGVYQNNPDVLGKISELDLAVKELGGSNNTDNLATKDDIKGMVKQVNSTNPDPNGNVTLTGLVKKVNNTAPTADGNVTIAIPSVAGFVKKVNNTAPDANGNVNVNLFPSGTTAQRPATAVVGQYFFDTTLNKPLYRNAANNGWVDGTGAPVT